MAYRVTHYPDRKLGVVEYWGRVNSEQIVAALVALFSSHHWREGWHALWDSREIGLLIVDLHGLEAVANWKQYFADTRRSGRSAVVAVRATESEIARLLLRYRETTSRQMQVFDELDEATTFLGVDWEPGDSAGLVTAQFEEAESVD